MESEIHEIKNAGKVIGRVDVPVFASVDEAKQELGEQSTLRHINRSIKSAKIAKEKALIKKAVEDKDQAAVVLNNWKKLTSDGERDEFCSWLGVTREQMESLEGQIK